MSDRKTEYDMPVKGGAWKRAITKARSNIFGILVSLSLFEQVLQIILSLLTQSTRRENNPRNWCIQITQYLSLIPKFFPADEVVNLSRTVERRTESPESLESQTPQQQF
jgi:hypothetical protein